MNEFNKFYCSIAVAIIWLFCSVLLEAQTSCSECAAKKYPYRFCTVENGKSVFKYECSNDPTAVNSNPLSGMKFNKLAIPTCINYSDILLFPTIKEIQFITDGDGTVLWNGYETDKIYKGKVYPCVKTVIERAVQSWRDVCGSNYTSTNEYNDCCIKVVWSTETNDSRLDPNDVDFVIAVSKSAGKSSTSCDGASCDESYIILNQEKPRFWGTVGFFPKRWHFMDENSKPTSNNHVLTEGMYNLYNTLLHEVGHQIGFPHPGEDVDRPKCDYESGIMTKKAGIYEDNWVLSNDDICMFKLIYCCAGTTGVDGEVMPDKFEVFPNPFTDRIILHCSDDFSNTGLLVTITDLMGKVFLKEKVPAGEKQITLDLQNAAVGAYFVEISDNAPSNTRSVIVIHKRK